MVFWFLIQKNQYIYKNSVKSNFNPFVHEAVANRFNINAFLPKNAKTNVILKTSLVSKTKESDIVNVKAHSFETKKHIETKLVLGGDGRHHAVPVEWIEYIPVSSESQIVISDLGNDDEVKFKNYGQSNVIYAKGLVSSQAGLNVDIEKIKSYMKKD